MRFGRVGALLDRIPYRHGPVLRGELREASVILDVGGGTGRIARHVRKGRVLVLDVEPHLLSRARAHGYDVVLADAAHLPIRDLGVDAVLMVDAFHHMPEQALVLAESRRVARECVVIEEFDPSSVGGRLIQLGERILRFGSTFHTPEDLARMAADAGLRGSIARRDPRDYAFLWRRERDAGDA